MHPPKECGAPGGPSGSKAPPFRDLARNRTAPGVKNGGYTCRCGCNFVYLLYTQHPNNSLPMEPKRLDFATVLTDAWEIGTKHAPSIIAAVILFLLTVWIPYINMGTLIALTLLPVRLARDEHIEPLSIFRSEYRRRMGDFLLTAALKQAAIALGTALLVIPGVVLALAWKPAYWCLAEHDKSPLEAIRAAEAATRGSKWRLFALFFAFTLCATVAGLALHTVCRAIGISLVSSIVLFAFVVLVLWIHTSLCAAVWKQLRDNVR